MKHFLAISVVSLAACVGEIGSSDDGDGDGSGSGSGEPVTCAQERTYVGFSGGPLEAERPTITAGSDRLRVKPYAALATEYNRALGLTDFATTAFAATFGRAPARWFGEPQASANTIYAAFALAYEGCTRKTAAGGNFAVAPTPAAADQLCRDFARSAWQREATDDEASTCATYAVSQTNPSDAPAKRWAYTCAAVLTASGFLSY